MNSIDPGSVPPLSSVQPQRSRSASSTAHTSHDAGSVTVDSSSQHVSNNGLSNRKATGKISRSDKDSDAKRPTSNTIDPSSQKRRKSRAPDTYPLFDGDKPWSQRSWAYELMPFRGMWYDLRRRKPYLLSDWVEGFEPRNWWTVANSVVRMYFINLMPAIAYVLDMNYRTGGSYGVNEVILASALAAIVFAIFSVQPLTFVGVTGLINLVNYTQYNIFVGYYGFDRLDYLRIQAWSLIWAAGFHFVVAIFNVCDFTRFITDMTSETFGFYVGIIYIQKGIELLIEEFEPLPLDNATGWLSVTIAILFTISVYLVAKVGNTTYLPFKMRNFVAGYAFAAGCIFWTGFSHFPKNSLALVPVERVPITRAFYPTLDRSWFIDFWNIELKYVFVGAPLGFLIMLLFYFDHNVSSVMAQARNYPVRKPAGFHWDFFLLGITTLVSGFLGLPAPNGLVPQAPVHTETLSVYKQVEKPDETKRIAREARRGARTRTVKQQHIVNVRVVENRLSHLIIGLLTLGTMTRPLLVVLGTMPRAVFAGIFILVGWASIERNAITLRTLAIFRDRRLSPPDEPLNSIRRSKIALFVGIQWLFAAMCIAISATIAGIGFPVIITLLIPVRYWVVPRWFSPLELKILDAPTADADGVLASLGHEPERVTGRGVEIALDTKIAGELYSKKSLLDESDDEEEGGGLGREKSASQFRDDYATQHRSDEEAQVRGEGSTDKTAASSREEGVDATPREAVRTVAGVGGHQTADPERHVEPASGAGVIASGLGSGVAVAAENDRLEEAEEKAEAQDEEEEEKVAAPAIAGASTMPSEKVAAVSEPTKEATSSEPTKETPKPVASQSVEPEVSKPAASSTVTESTKETPKSHFVEQVSEPVAPSAGTALKSPKKRRYVTVENPPRGAGTAPPPVQWRQGEASQH
ncbi:Bicarbonate transporter, C-terminal [Kalmanozyma brasiliensis GHG001]|uniref:Bicarbonate transporter, C-terminal n=1 Tax=Kalmanozyma brasiliensis (strain GHG001) TaxID=1365824 RepID=UPI0028683AF2|nr:Bicarbonate transporter, C-terminal [Kalmanozyma brasiliensis GHG001]KAF6767125.1 Bicarbonate transporter, C-terminal [Kalmanozyma brasiliensis GHG001]